MSNIERGPGPEITEFQRTENDYWDYERFKLSPEKVKEIEALYREYQDKKKMFETFEDQIRQLTKEIHTSNTEEGWRRRQPMDLDKEHGVRLEPDGGIYAGTTRLETRDGTREWVSITPEEQASYIKSALEKNREIFQALSDRAEKINQQKREELNNPEFDFWVEYARMRGTMRESGNRTFTLAKEHPSFEELPLVDDPKFMEKVKENLLSQDLPQDHPFKTILETYVGDYNPTSENDIRQILTDAKIDFSDADAIRDNEENRKRAFLDKLKTMLLKDNLAPDAIRYKFRQIVATYIFEGGYKMIPFRTEELADLDIETFLKTLEERVGKTPSSPEKKLMESSDPELRRLALEAAARARDEAERKKPKK